MFTRIFSKKTKLDKEIEDVLEIMSNLAPDSREYSAISDNLEKLYKLRDMEKKRNSISKDTIVLVGANLLGIALVLNYEKIDVVTSKAFGLIIKGRV